MLQAAKQISQHTPRPNLCVSNHETVTCAHRAHRRRLDEPQDVQPDEPRDGAQPDVRSSEEAGLPRHDADGVDCGRHSASDGDCANAADVEAEEAGVRSPDPTCRK